MSHQVSEECIACGACVPECPARAISEGGERAVIDRAACSDCGTCVEVCPVGACLPG